MGREQFRADLRRWAKMNRLRSLNEIKLLEGLGPDIEADARFINVFAGTRRNEYLVVTSLRTVIVSTGVFSTKVKWASRHQDLISVSSSRGMFGDCVMTEVRLMSEQGLQEFQVGFHDRNDHYGIDIAGSNASTIVEQIETAQAPVSISNAAHGCNQEVGGGSTVGPLGPEQAGDAAKEAYDVARFDEALRLYVTAIDRLHTLYVGEQFRNREPGPRDAWMVEGLISSVGAARAVDSAADVRESVREATHRLRTIATALENAGGTSVLYRRGLDGLARYAPDVDVSDVFWQ